MLGLWSLVSAGEAFTDEDKAKRIRFWVDMGAYAEMRATGHPAFASPFFEEWEILGVMKDVAATMNADRAAQQLIMQRR